MDRFNWFEQNKDDYTNNELQNEFNNQLINHNLTMDDIMNPIDITNKFKDIIMFCELLQLNDIEYDKLKDKIVFEIIFGDKKELIQYIPGMLLEKLEEDNYCVINRECSCKKIDDICGKRGYNHLYCLKYLMEVQNKDCTTNAINNASKNGYLDVIKYLFEVQNKDCTTDAIDYASENGHLDVIKYLFEVQHKDCTTSAINNASLYGHLDVVNYLKSKIKS